ncbi:MULTISPECIES: helix-turn-helix transcriptional regulator [Phyllobacteriaceae]|uniref:Helix-turn-helix transcriptional regulator n=1 Tax=Ollibium composti TaxID=2675109 RepID=A0ABY2QA99_9HYPH|nr:MULTISPECIES: helix-turn-helix transcriptional regulator [Mesorhizobium]QDB99246.1 helix-turn-helix transcriptional regulator [Mesorhizobium sp. 8]THF58364.1 helix-turn-helix transcriptional regulator [Mesorhizobium composti]
MSGIDSMADNDNTAAIIDEIYEAPFVPERWPAILEKLAGMADAEGGLLTTLDGNRTGNWVASDFAVPLMERYIEGGYEKYNTRPQRNLAKRYAGFMTDLDVMTEAEMATDIINLEILLPAGVGWTASTYISIPSGDQVGVIFDRRIERGPYESPALKLLDGFRPHLARAGLLAARLHLQEAQNATETMRRLGLPAAAVDADGRVIAKNDLLDTLEGQVGIRARDRIYLTSPTADVLLADSLARMARKDTGGVASIPLPTVEHGRAAILHLVPIRRMAHDVFARTVALAIVTPLVPAPAPHADILGGLFDLSPAEDRVARALLGGMSVQDCAVAFRVSQETVRAQLKSIFAKTATSRQTELLQLLAATTSLPIRG